MTEPAEPAPDVVPVLAFQALDWADRFDAPLTLWQRRLLIDLYGAGPVPSPEETPR